MYSEEPANLQLNLTPQLELRTLEFKCTTKYIKNLQVYQFTSEYFDIVSNEVMNGQRFMVYLTNGNKIPARVIDVTDISIELELESIPMVSPVTATFSPIISDKLKQPKWINPAIALVNSTTTAIVDVVCLIPPHVEKNTIEFLVYRNDDLIVKGRDAYIPGRFIASFDKKIWKPGRYTISAIRYQKNTFNVVRKKDYVLDIDNESTEKIHIWQQTLMNLT